MFNLPSDRLRESITDKDSSSGLVLTLKPLGATNAPKTTFSLQTSQIHEACNEEGIQEMPKQMTIFYGGRVIVVENILSNKAKEIMQLANSFASSSACHTGSLKKVTKLPETFVHDLSQKRSRSLSRFFEKRKDRIIARAPYTLSDNYNKPVEPDHKSWLQLATGNQ